MVVVGDSVAVADGVIVAVGVAVSAVARLEEFWAEHVMKAWLTASRHRRREAPDTMATCREKLDNRNHKVSTLLHHRTRYSRLYA